jgi:hypothetical protein
LIFVKLIFFLKFDEKRAQEIRKLFYGRKKVFFTDPDEQDVQTDVSTESEDEGEEQRKAYKDEPANIHLNHLQIRSLLQQHFYSQFGTRPSMANCTLAHWSQRVSKAYSRTIVPNQQPQPTWRIYFEGFVPDEAAQLRCYGTAPFEDQFSPEPWTKLGTFHATFSQDICDAVQIIDIRVWVTKMKLIFLIKINRHSSRQKVGSFSVSKIEHSARLHFFSPQ